MGAHIKNIQKKAKENVEKDENKREYAYDIDKNVN